MWPLRLLACAACALGTLSCAKPPTSGPARETPESRADATLRDMRRRDPSLANLLASSAGYVVFPSIGKGSVIVGGAYGQGVLYENDRPTGVVELDQASIGAQLGGQTFSELVILRERFDVERLRRGSFSFGASVSAVALTTGAGATAHFQNGVAVFTVPRGGLMAELSISGQRFEFTPYGG